MPIQPLAPTLRVNSRENDPFPPYGENVPASISSRKKVRTSSRNSLASGGSSTGSKRKLKLIVPHDPAVIKGHSPSAPRSATIFPRRAAQTASLPNSSRQDHSRRVAWCSECSYV